MPPILDVAIGVIFVFLLFSLVVSALNEVILSALDRRARFLREGIEELFRDSGENPTITASDFFKHGMIVVLSRGKFVPPTKKEAKAAETAETPKPGKKSEWDWILKPARFLLALLGFGRKDEKTVGIPSYIPGKSFVLALIGLLTKGENPADDRDLRGTISGIANQELKQTLLALHDDARGNLDHFKANIENWFNESMDRVGGWYKRHAQEWLLRLSIILAITCNIDSVRIIRSLSIDPKLLENIVSQAGQYAIANADAKKAPADDKVAKFKSTLAALGGTGIPMGWTDGPSQQLLSSLPSARNWFNPRFWWENIGTDKTLSALTLWLSAIIGWAVTALAASLGAPFWFDTLNRFIDIRGVGRAPEEKDPTAPKKRATGVESYVVSGDAPPAPTNTSAKTRSRKKRQPKQPNPPKP